MCRYSSAHPWLLHAVTAGAGGDHSRPSPALYRLYCTLYTVHTVHWAVHRSAQSRISRCTGHSQGASTLALCWLTSRIFLNVTCSPVIFSEWGPVRGQDRYRERGWSRVRAVERSGSQQWRQLETSSDQAVSCPASWVTQAAENHPDSHNNLNTDRAQMGWTVIPVMMPCC